MGYTIKSIEGELKEYAFDFGGVVALRNFTARANGNRLIIESAENANFTILDALVNEVEIDGIIYDNVFDAQKALQRLVFSPTVPKILTEKERETIANFKTIIQDAQVYGAKTYQTKSELLAVTPVPSDGTAAKVANDSDRKNNGYYAVVDGAWVKDDDTVGWRIDRLEDNSTKILDVTRLRTEDGYYRHYPETQDVRFVGAEGWRASELLPVNLGDVITISSSILTSATATNAIFNESRQAIGVVNFDLESKSITITAELKAKGVAYLGISFRPSDVPQILMRRQINLQRLSSDVSNLSMLRFNPNNTYRGVAPGYFKDKLLQSNEDLNIVLLGDSVTALTNVGSEFESSANLPCGCQHNAITYQLWDSLCKNKPMCDRFDSQVNTFTENGTFSMSEESKFNSPSNYGEYSPAGSRYRETSTNSDSFSFNWNLSDFEKLNLIGRMGIDGTNIARITCPSGKILVQHNERANPKNDDNLLDNSWVEANGYTFTQHLEAIENHTHWLRNFPLHFKRVEGQTGDITITITNKSDGVMYYWGTERWNGSTVHVTNIARAGRNTSLLRRNIEEELLYRDVDVVVFQLPLWNDLKGGGNVDPILEQHNLIIDKIKELSVGWSRFQMIINMYHTQLASWEGNKSIQFQANGIIDRPKTDLTDWECCSKIANNVLKNENYNPKHLVFANLYAELFNFAFSSNITMQELLDSARNTNIGSGTGIADGVDSSNFTIDGTHLSSSGFKYYAQLIATMFY